MKSVSIAGMIFYKAANYYFMKKFQLCFVAILVSFFYIGLQTGLLGSLSGKQDKPLITAHRGDSSHAPENTLSAFDLAIQSGADCIEMDVRRTKDGVLVVLHDDNLKRLTGYDVSVRNLDCREVTRLHIENPDFPARKNTQICTLEDALSYCQGKVLLNLDLKIPDAEEKVVSLIQKYDLSDDCEITAQDASCLMRIKALDPRIRTILLILPSSAYDIEDPACDFTDKPFIDGISIRSDYITASLVRSIHRKEKVIYAWTVNSRRSIERMCRLGVDCIITDRPSKATVCTESIYR